MTAPKHSVERAGVCHLAHFQYGNADAGCLVAGLRQNLFLYRVAFAIR